MKTSIIRSNCGDVTRIIVLLRKSRLVCQITRHQNEGETHKQKSFSNRQF